MVRTNVSAQEWSVTANITSSVQYGQLETCLSSTLYMVVTVCWRLLLLTKDFCLFRSDIELGLCAMHFNFMTLLFVWQLHISIPFSVCHIWATARLSHSNQPTQKTICSRNSYFSQSVQKSDRNQAQRVGKLTNKRRKKFTVSEILIENHS